MILSNREELIKGGRKHADAKGPLAAWFADAEQAQWRNPADIKQRYASASFLTGNVVIFNIKGNRYRLAVRVNYTAGLVLVKWFGTHAEYDKMKF
jgi:mRNA interferase HigB